MATAGSRVVPAHVNHPAPRPLPHHPLLHPHHLLLPLPVCVLTCHLTTASPVLSRCALATQSAIAANATHDSQTKQADRLYVALGWLAFLHAPVVSCVHSSVNTGSHAITHSKLEVYVCNSVCIHM